MGHGPGGPTDEGETDYRTDQADDTGPESVPVMRSARNDKRNMETPESGVAPLLNAVAFAARAHRPQLRKDGQTPYVSHVFRVCLVVWHVFGVDDPRVLTAAVLHDTIEDTTTDYDDLREQFGDDVAS